MTVFVMLSFMVSVIMLNVVMPNVIVLSVIMLSATATKTCRAIHKSKRDWPKGPDIWAKASGTISRGFSDEKITLLQF